MTTTVDVFHDNLPVSDPPLSRHGAPLAERTITILALSSDSLSLYRGLSEIWLKEHTHSMHQ